MKPLDTPPPSTTQLGDWHANLVHVGRQQFVLMVSEHTFLPIVIEAAPISDLLPRFSITLLKVLLSLEIPQGDIDRELAELETMHVAKTANRQVTGVVVDHERMLDVYVENALTPLEMSVAFAGVPCGPLYKRHVFPDRETRALFGFDAVGWERGRE
ncbi:MAG: hypothetical protein U0174_22700 [Polyangiaceae bacterium]